MTPRRGRWTVPGGRPPDDITASLALRRTRRTSATDHAWNGQPVAACGAAPSAVSETDPRPHSPRCGYEPVEQAVRRRRRRGRAASTYGPISHGQTVPWW